VYCTSREHAATSKLQTAAAAISRVGLHNAKAVSKTYANTYFIWSGVYVLMYIGGTLLGNKHSTLVITR